MIDWFVLLIPLLVLTLIVLFGFVGCALDSEGGPGFVPLTLQYAPGLQTDVKSIDVTFTYAMFHTEIFHEVKVGNGEVSATLKNDSINSSGGLIAAGSDISLTYRAEITCKCVVITSPAPADADTPETEHVLDAAEREKDEDENPPTFQLQRAGSEFEVQ
jgi:hypothetical protein